MIRVNRRCASTTASIAGEKWRSRRSAWSNQIDGLMIFVKTKRVFCSKFSQKLLPPHFSSLAHIPLVPLSPYFSSFTHILLVPLSAIPLLQLVDAYPVGSAIVPCVDQIVIACRRCYRVEAVMKFFRQQSHPKDFSIRINCSRRHELKYGINT
jgi:hypothetical protein